MSKTIKLGDIEVGERNPCFIIAEAGINHNGDFETAKKLIDIGKKSGSDTVKFHAYRTNEIYIREAELPEYVKRNMGEKISFYDMAEKMLLSDDELFKLKKYCDENDVMFSCTPYGHYGIELMNKLGCDFFKVSSTYLEATPLLKEMARTLKPIVLSTGMGDLQEVELAKKDILEEGNNKLIILHCTTNYPCPYEQVNLNVLDNFKKQFSDVLIGYSDHTKGIIVPVLASLKGAVLVEKHFTISRDMEGPDHKASLEPEELKIMVEAIRYFEENKTSDLYEAAKILRNEFKPAELVDLNDDEIKALVNKILGSSEKKPTTSEQNIRDQARLSIVSSVDIPKGSTINEDMLKYTRPGTGLSPREYNNVVGKKAKEDIPKNKILKLSGNEVTF